MPKILARLFSTRYMVKPSLQRGDILPTRQAYNELRKIALPSIVEMVSIAVIGMADTAMVSRLGAYAVAAVGLTVQPRMVFMSVFFALNISVTAIVSRRRGQGEQQAARLCVRQALKLEIGIVLLLSVLQVVFAVPIMRFSGANESTLAASAEYFRVMGFGLVFPALSTAICSAQRGVGRTKITMVVNLTANIVNVIFNFLLIGGNFGFPRLGVAGAAIATVIGNGVGFVLALMSLMNHNAYLRISPKDNWKFDGPMLKTIAGLIGGAAVEQFAIRFGFLWFAAVVAGLGTDNFAAHQIVMQLLNLSFTFADGIAVATTALVGQNLGKKRPDLSIMYGKIGQRFAFLVSVLLCIVSIAGRFLFVRLFTDEAHIIALTTDIIVILGVILLFQTSQIVMAGSLRGAGDTKFVAFTMFLTVIMRPIITMALFAFLHTGLYGAWYAILFDQIVRLVMLFTRFSRGKWINIEV